MSVTAEVLLLADTHLGPGAADKLTARIFEHLRVADVVLHAGDITDGSVLEALIDAAPNAAVHAVAGNLDRYLDLPDRLVVDIAGCAVAMVHDGGRAVGRGPRLRRWFPEADLVAFGHSHAPWHAVHVRPSDRHAQHQLNPGSAMLRRRAPTCTVARVGIAGGRVARVRLVPLI